MCHSDEGRYPVRFFQLVSTKKTRARPCTTQSRADLAAISISGSFARNRDPDHYHLPFGHLELAWRILNSTKQLHFEHCFQSKLFLKFRYLQLKHFPNLLRIFFRFMPKSVQIQTDFLVKSNIAGSILSIRRRPESSDTMIL